MSSTTTPPLSPPFSPSIVRIFFAGDFMPGRGVDAVMPSPCPREIREGYCKNALDYAHLAEKNTRRSFSIGKVTARDLLGEVSRVIDRYEPHARIVNLETSVTKKSTFYPRKSINYRASEENVFALFEVVQPDVVSLANNHAMDFSREGLEDTLKFFDKNNVKRIGAGRNVADAMQPAVLENVYPRGFAPARNDKRGASVAAYGLCFEDSGVPTDWKATERSMGVFLAAEGDKVPERLLNEITEMKKKTSSSNDAIVVVSVHFGSNWGYEIARTHVTAAKALIDAGADIIHGHSSHHAKTAMMYKKKLILFGCGEFFNDYEGISSHPGFPETSYLGHLRLLYFVDIDAKTHDFKKLEIVLMRQKMFALTTLENPREEAEQFLATLRQQYAFGHLKLQLKGDGATLIAWPDDAVRLQRQRSDDLEEL